MENKYYKDGYWYKQNISGYEGLAEEACSMIFPPGGELESQISHAAAKPFSGSFGQQAIILGTGIRLDYSGISFSKIYNIE